MKGFCLFQTVCKMYNSNNETKKEEHLKCIK